jgi:hypothetical protein
MNAIQKIEEQLGLQLPADYKDFLLNADKLTLAHKSYDIYIDNFKSGAYVGHLFTAEEFLHGNRYRDYLVEYQEHFEHSTNYVEAEYLYHIGINAIAICIALGGRHYGKIYSADNGGWGIVYLADNINSFIAALYEFRI